MPEIVTWNPSDKDSGITLSGGNLIATKGGGNQYGSVRATVARSATDAGGHYFEVQVTSGAMSRFMFIGLANASFGVGSALGSDSNSWGYYQELGTKWHSGSGAAYGESWTTGDVIGVLLKNGNLYFRKNGTWQNGADVGAETGEAFSGLAGPLFPAAALYRSTAPAHVLTARFKAADFTGSIPTGASAWES